MHWPQFKVLPQRYTGTRFGDQRQCHLPQKHKATVPESTLSDEMNGLEEQDNNAKARDLFWKPLSRLGTIRPTTTTFDAFDALLARDHPPHALLARDHPPHDHLRRL